MNGGFSLFNFGTNARLTALDASVRVWFREALTAAEADVRSEYEGSKRPLIDTVTMPGGGETGNMEYVIATLEGDLKDIEDGSVPVYTPEGASVRSEAKPNGFIVEISEYQLDDDKYGILQMGVKRAASKVARWKYKQIGKSIVDGFTRKTVDGLSYFNAAHYVNLRNSALSTFSNLATLPLTADNFATVRSRFRVIPQEDGEAIYDNNPDVLVVSGKNETAAENIVANPTLFGGANNPNWKKAEIIVVPEWDNLPKSGGGTYEDLWCLFRTKDSAVKPLIWNERMAPRITPIQPRMGKNGRLYRWFIDARAEVAFYDPRIGYASLPS